MAFNACFPGRFLFSIFKKKVVPLRAGDHSTPQSLYASLSVFQSQLSHLQLKKMPKTLQTFSRRLRRLLKTTPTNTIQVPLALSHTFQAYSRTVDEIIFGTEEQQIDTSLQQMVEFTSQMVKCDLNPYLLSLIPRTSTHASLYQRILERFVNIEERISREIFKGYFGFARTVSKIAFLEEREYKGDFKFQLVNQLPTVELAVQAIYNCALFNKVRDKLALACELAIVERYEHLSNETLGKLLFCLANAGRSLKFVEENFQTVKQRVSKEHPLGLLYYMTVGGLQDAVWFQEISNKLVITPKNVHEQSVAKMIQVLLAERFNCYITVQESKEFQRPWEKHEGELFFEDFLSRYGYEYCTSRLAIFPYTVYSLQGKIFLCFDGFAIKDEAFTMSGVGMITTQYFHGRGEAMKHLNWVRMVEMDKRGERDEYILSKFKGIERPKKVKVRYYD